MNIHEMLIRRSRGSDPSLLALEVEWTSEIPSYKQIEYYGWLIPPTFTTEDALPAGVTMSTHGLLTYDGTPCPAGTHVITVTASSGGVTMTTTATIVMEALPAIPTDYAFYASLSERSATSESGHTLSYSSSGIQPAVVGGIPCMSMLRSDTSNSSSIKTGFSLVSDTAPFTLTCWVNKISNDYDTGFFGSTGGLAFRGTVLDSTYGYNLQTTITESPMTGRIQAGTITSGEWHCIVFTGDGTKCSLYIDGVQAGYSSTYSGYSQPYSLLIGNGWGGNSWNGYLASYRFYRRALTPQERAAIQLHDFDQPSDSSSSDVSDSSSSSSSSDSSSSSSSSGGITPVLPTDYARRYALTSNLKDSAHSSSTDYDLTKPSYASVSYGTEDGITGCKVTGSCLYNTWTTGLSTTNGFAVSLWAKCASVPASTANAKAIVNLSQQFSSNSYYIGYINGCWCGGTAASSTAQIIQSTTAVDASWHCIALNWNKADAQVELWLDGVLQGVITGVSSLTIYNKGVTVNAGEASQGSSPDGKPDVNVRYRDITIFARTLTEAEILGLAQEH